MAIVNSAKKEIGEHVTCVDVYEAQCCAVEGWFVRKVRQGYGIKNCSDG